MNTIRIAASAACFAGGFLVDPACVLPGIVVLTLRCSHPSRAASTHTPLEAFAMLARSARIADLLTGHRQAEEDSELARLLTEAFAPHTPAFTDWLEVFDFASGAGHAVTVRIDGGTWTVHPTGLAVPAAA